jgi:5-methylcytosine-specific restriction endonuclease McrA
VFVVNIKICKKCGKAFPATTEFFYANVGPKYKEPLRPKCKQCWSKEKRERCFGQYNIENRQDVYKNCPECGNRYPATTEYFYKAKGRLFGVSVKCRSCSNKQSVESSKKWYIANKEHCAERWQRYYRKNREYHLERARKYKEANPEKVKHNYRRKDRRRRKEKAGLPVTFTIEQWLQCKEHFKHKCAYCGKKKKLTQDHFVALVNGGEYTRDNILPACINCNSSKNNKDFFDWYPEQKFYSATRERKILQYLNHDGKSQQITLLALGL